jgi:large subunit ribosomal protein L35
MPKIKTNRASAKRFKRTGTGKIRRYKANANHILTKKTRKRKRNLRTADLIVKDNAREVRRLLPNLGI